MELTLKDGKKLQVEKGTTGEDLANKISPSFAKNCIAYKLNEETFDLYTPIKGDGNLIFITNKDQEGLEILRHSCAHLMAHAISRLYKNAKLTIGPTIEDGFYYDIDFGKTIPLEDLEKIEKEMHKISEEKIDIRRSKITYEKAKELFKGNKYKIELINEYKDSELSIYKQKDFVDLCRGVHVVNTSLIKFFKLTAMSGAYWRGDSKNAQLTRIYGTCFFSKEELDNYLKILEERKERDHRKIGKELELFMLSDFGPGMPFFLPNGMILRNTLEQFWIKRHEKEGYVFVNTPIMLSKELWKTSGHWGHYKNNMYTSKIEGQEFAIKPMSCPGSILIYKNSIHSYKDLPLRMAELGHVHRHEASGALNGLFRVRSFTQDDAHIYLRMDQLQKEIISLIKLYDEIYKIFGLSYHVELSTRPESDYIGSIEVWNQSEHILEEALKAANIPYKINPGDGAFYGPKLDYKIKDSMNRIWQCGTIQLDMNLPERFDISYIDKNGERVRPIMLHRALLGSIERFIGIIIEHFNGIFPLWIAPVQAIILPVNPKFHNKYCKAVKKEMESLGIRVKLDDSFESLGFRLRNAQVKKIPITIVVGDKEVKGKKLTYRIIKTKDQITVSKDKLIKSIVKNIQNRSIEPKI